MQEVRPYPSWWSIVWQWVGATTAACSLGGWVGGNIGGDTDWVIGGFIAVTVTWIVQSVIVRRLIDHPYVWFFASLVGFVCGVMLFTLISWQIDQWLFGIVLTLAERRIIISLVFGIVGTMVGLMQLLLLRSYLKYSWVWVLSNAVGWPVSIFLLGITNWSVPLSIALVVGFTSMGFAQGIINGITLGILLHLTAKSA